MSRMLEGDSMTVNVRHDRGSGWRYTYINKPLLPAARSKIYKHLVRAIRFAIAFALGYLACLIR